MKRTLFSFEHYMNKAYGQLTCTDQEIQQLKAMGVAIASTPMSLESGSIAYWIGVTQEQMTRLKQADRDLADRISSTPLALHPQLGSPVIRPMHALNEQELLAELTYEKARAQWVAHSTPDDHQSDQDREDHRIYFALPDAKYGIRPHRSGIQVRVEQLTSTIESVRNLARLGQEDPLMAGLHWDHLPEGSVVVRMLKDEQGFVWALSNYEKEALTQARRARINSLPAHTVTQEEFAQGCIVFAALPGRKRALVHDEPGLSGGNMDTLRQYFGNLHDRLKASGHLAPDSADRKNWISHSIISLLETHPDSSAVYFDDTQAGDKKLPPGRFVRTAPGMKVSLKALHESVVKSALEEGLDVPERVLADYPSLSQEQSRERERNF